MRRHLIHFLLVALLLACSAATAFAQVAVKGQVVDAENGDPMIGAAVTVVGSTQGVVTDVDGNFALSVAPNATLSIKYLGYKELKKKITQNKAQVDLGVIKIEVDAVALSDVTITSSIAVARKTPVAVSTIGPTFIAERLGTQEFPEILKSTPGVYATKQGGGYGDSRVNLRGFASANIAVMVNGVPMNDMEWGGVYWSNWAGLSDVTRSMQVQRGLGASKISSPSVGGSINIVTNSTNAKKGGAVSYGVGNDGYNKMLFALSTGMNEKGWAVSILGSKTWGDGYIRGTAFNAYSWFINVSKRLGDKHVLSLTATGAPQSHNKRYDKLTIAQWELQKSVGLGDGYRYNATYGFDANGRERVSTNYNYYHKPQVSLNHIWDINIKSSLSSSLYLSIGDGYGYRAVGDNYSTLYGATNGVPNTTYRKKDGTFDYAALMENNANSANGSLAAVAKNMNNHVWYGLLSTYKNQLTSNLDFQAGLDLRYYKGTHVARIADLYGGQYVIDPDRANVPYKSEDIAWQNEKLYIGDIVYRDYESYIGQYGAFTQLEYTKDKLSTFVSANANVNTYKRQDHFYYNDEKSDSKTKIGYGVKGGANYNLDEHHNAFANVGFFSRTPFYSGGVFLNSTTSNLLNPNSKNEKVISFELGYGYTSRVFNATVNVYRTSWLDKSITKSKTDAQESAYLNLNGVDALHQGIELEFTYKPLRKLQINGMLSLGDWQWKSNAKGYWYNKNGQALDQNQNITTIGSADHASSTLNLDGIKVGNSAQTTAYLAVSYELLKGLYFNASGNFYGRNYSDYDITSTNKFETGVEDVAQPWRIPSAYVFDSGLSYHFKIGDLDATWITNCNNVLNEHYITDAKDNGAKTGGHGWQDATVFYGFGRTWSMSMKVKF
ncbi:carboxypeptidase-like regulatory domain-containing protein [uncultured Bacteroides sp.]|uniref:TonB-dependent receptor n=1 Tax=uncultured Bacteroides sp. TaxID=162156 RepID=UPI002AAB5646|nr:carboxypeptidase-like regulatory domain-containing protein [uncultured Bacteroides sp.]